MYDKKFYERNLNFQTELADAIAEHIAISQNPKSILDVGCGCGHFAARIARLSSAEVIGINGDRPKNREIEIFIHDLKEPFDLDRKFDLVISLEVAEHIPRESAEGFIYSLVVHARKYILFSAATPGQGGIGHINEKPHEYWHKQFLKHCFKVNDCIRPLIAGNKKVPFWYRDNIFLYERQKHG